MLLALGLVMTGCASKKAAGPVSVHPRSYTFDVIDGGSDVLELKYNQYGPNYQVTPYFSTLVKTDNPLAGDTITFKMKAVSDVDLPLLLVYPCSTSPSWTNLAGDSFVFAENVKAGEAFECEVSFVLTANMGADFALCMQYDNEDQEVKTGGPCKLTLERICESTDTRKEIPEDPHVSEVTLAVETYAAFLEIATNHPWINGAQDMSVISNYQATPEITPAFGDDLPIVGDTVTLTWTAVANADVDVIYCRLVDCSAAANWWKELNTDFNENLETNYVLARDIKAGEPFHVELVLPVMEAPVAQVNLCMWYDVGSSPDAPSIFKKAAIDDVAQ
jgi:hypothetical protein